MSDLFEEQNAIFSEDRKYRYVLIRRWDKNLPMIAFVGLNPSTADETQSDNTITKVKKVAKNNGYGGFYMLNLFGIIDSNPDIILTHPDPIGKQNVYLTQYIFMSKDVCFCWGVFKQARQRAEEMVKLFPEALCFKHTKDGHPWHPLYCKDDTKLIKF
jgi:hypothetical protein